MYRTLATHANIAPKIVNLMLSAELATLCTRLHMLFLQANALASGPLDRWTSSCQHTALTKKIQTPLT